MPNVAYRAIRSRRAFVNAPKVKAVLEQALDGEVKPHFIKAFEWVVANWEHKPDFKARKSIGADAISISVYPAGANKKIYIYVTKGTRPHPIPRTPKSKGWLAFMWGGPGSYKAKTAPGGKFGGPGVVVGGKMTFAKQVQHPGFEGRNFEKVIKDDNKRWFSRTMESAWRRAIRAMSSG